MFPDESVIPSIFSALAITGFMAVGVLCYQRKIASAFVLVVAASLAGVFGQIDHISEVSASASQLTFKVREASDVLDQLKGLAVISANSLIQEDENAAVISLGNAVDRDHLREDILGLLANLHVDKQDTQKLADSIKVAVCKEFAQDIINFVITEPNVIPQNKTIFAYHDYAMLSVKYDKIPPELLRDLLKKYDVSDPFAKRLMDGYDFFFKNGFQQDVAFWAGRDTWPGKISVIVGPSNPPMPAAP